MKTNGKIFLIAGVSPGIGFVLAETLANADNKVIICCRRENKLNEAKLKKLPMTKSTAKIALTA